MTTATTTRRLLFLCILLALTHPAVAQPIGAPSGSSNSIGGFLAEIQANVDWEGVWKPVVKTVIQFLIGIAAVVALNSKGAAIQNMVGYVLVFLVALAAIAFVGTL